LSKRRRASSRRWTSATTTCTSRCSSARSRPTASSAWSGRRRARSAPTRGARTSPATRRRRTCPRRAEAARHAPGIPMGPIRLDGLAGRLGTACLLALALAVASPPPHALDRAAAAAMAGGSAGERIAASQAAVAEPAATLAAFLQAMLEGRVRLLDGRAIVVEEDGSARDAVDGTPVDRVDQARSVVNNYRMRRELGNAIASLELLAPEDEVRLAAARRIADKPDAARLPLMERALAEERVAGIRALLAQARAAVLVTSPDRSLRLAAARDLGSSREPAVRALLE